MTWLLLSLPFTQCTSSYFYLLIQIDAEFGLLTTSKRDRLFKIQLLRLDSSRPRRTPCPLASIQLIGWHFHTFPMNFFFATPSRLHFIPQSVAVWWTSICASSLSLAWLQIPRLLTLVVRKAKCQHDGRCVFACSHGFHSVTSQHRFILGSQYYVVFARFVFRIVFEGVEIANKQL